MIRFASICVLGYLLSNVAGQGSMREWCTGNSSFRYPLSGSCKGYWDCDHGNVTYRTCPAFQLFDSIKSECVWAVWDTSHVTCGQGIKHIDHSWCSKGSVYKSPVNGQCNSYWSCNDGQVSLEHCTWPMDFNPVDRVCAANIWPMEFDCYKVTATQPTTTAKPRCPYGSTFSSPYPSDCSKYYKCDNGKETIEECGTWQKFDSISNECRYDYWGSSINCVTIQNHTTKLMPTIQPTTKIVSTRLPTNKPLSRFACLNGDYFTKADPSDCQKYYVCSNGTVTHETCSKLMKFNPLTHVCVLEFIFNTVNCSAIPEKPICKLGYKFRTGYAGDCSKYYTCEKGKLAVTSCSTFQKFDSDINECRYETPWSDIKCTPDNPSTNLLPTIHSTTTPPARIVQTTPQASPQPKPRKSCLSGNHFTIADSEDCQKYYSCSNGTLTNEKCFWFQKFNPLTHECQFQMIFNTVNCSAHSAKPVCKVGDNYKAVFAGNSAKYWNCSNGKLSEEECGYLLSYDDLTQSCKFAVFRYNLEQKYLDSKDDKCRTGTYYNSSFDGDCHKYYECKNGTMSEKECNYAEKYDDQLGKCVSMSQCDLLTCYDKGAICYPGLHYKTSIQGNCADYSECTDGKWSTKSCPFLHYFDPMTLDCKLKYFNAVDCNAKPKCSNESILDIIERKNNIVDHKMFEFNEDISCLKGNYFTMVDPSDCQKYFTCANGIVKEEHCSWFQKFNPITHECQLSFIFHSVNCSARPEKPVCKAGYNYTMSYPGNSVKYWSCNDDLLSQEYCGYLTYYDQPTQSCKFKIDP